MEKMYTTEEVAEILQIGRRTVYNYIKAGQIKAVKVGRHWRVTEEALQAFAETGTEKNYMEKLK